MVNRCCFRVILIDVLKPTSTESRRLYIFLYIYYFITLLSHTPYSTTAIEKLSLASNNLRGLPDEIAACTTLEELYLSNNAKFSYFPGSAGHLRCVLLICVRLLLLFVTSKHSTKMLSTSFRCRCSHSVCLFSFLVQEVKGIVAGKVSCFESPAQHK